MFRLKFNPLKFSKRELIDIGKSFKHHLKENAENDTFHTNVLKKDRTDLFGHLLSLFVLSNIHKTLGLSVSQLLDFLIDVEEKYMMAPYHTFYHASDVMTVLYYFCHDLDTDNYISNIDKSYLMMAALCHDIGHPGLNNSYQVKAKTDLLQKYGDQSTLERYSVDLTLQLFNKHHIAMDEMTIKDLILSTDMMRHSTLEKQAKDLLKEINTASLCRVLLHAADISNMVRPWLVSKQWSDLIIQELFNQGDEEKKRNMAISPGMDRDQHTQQSISLNFSKLIMPYFQTLAQLLPKSRVLLDHLSFNRIQWESLNTTKTKRRASQQQQLEDYYRPIRYKRIRLGNRRSQSYPTIVLYSNIIEEESNIIPFLNLRSYSLLYDETKSSTIVLVHPYDTKDIVAN